LPDGFVKIIFLESSRFIAGFVKIIFLQDYNNSDALRLIRWTILVDTVNLSEEAKKATAADVQVLHKIETILELSPGDRYRSLSGLCKTTTP
jgi:hypothetical protein